MDFILFFQTIVLFHCYKISNAEVLQSVLNNIIIVVFTASHLLERTCSERGADGENIGKIITAQLASNKSCEIDSKSHINILCA